MRSYQRGRVRPWSSHLQCGQRIRSVDIRCDRPHSCFWSWNSEYDGRPNTREPPAKAPHERGFRLLWTARMTAYWVFARLGLGFGSMDSGPNASRCGTGVATPSEGTSSFAVQTTAFMTSRRWSSFVLFLLLCGFFF